MIGKKNVRLFHFLNERGKRLGKKYNFSLVAEVLALVFLGLSEHPMNSARWFVLIGLSIITVIAFIANE